RLGVPEHRLLAFVHTNVGPGVRGQVGDMLGRNRVGLRPGSEVMKAYALAGCQGELLAVGAKAAAGEAAVVFRGAEDFLLAGQLAEAGEVRAVDVTQVPSVGREGEARAAERGSVRGRKLMQAPPGRQFPDDD